MTAAETGAVRIVPANEATADDLRVIFGERGDAATCQCQWFKVPRAEWRGMPTDELRQRLEQQTHCGESSRAGRVVPTSGLTAYVDDEPAGWCAVEPRIEYPRLRSARVPWTGRDDDKDDAGVWVLSCFVVRTGFRGRGLMHALTAAAVEFARDRGAASLEGYPIVVREAERLSWGELYVGTASTFEAAGFREVSRPTQRRSVMRIDFDQSGG